MTHKHQPSLTAYASEQLNEIYQLSRVINGLTSKKHLDTLCQLLRNHVEEIELLRLSGNKHYLIETGDLMILCLEILLENNQSVDDMLSQCYARYKKKLTTLSKARIR